MKKKKPVVVRASQVTDLDRLYRTLRRQINRLGLLVRATGVQTPPEKLQRSAEQIFKTSTHIRKLIRQLPRPPKR